MVQSTLDQDTLTKHLLAIADRLEAATFALNNHKGLRAFNSLESALRIFKGVQAGVTSMVQEKPVSEEAGQVWLLERINDILQKEKQDNDELHP